MYSVLERAPAKINLFLDVLNKRCDGFHNIKSIMASVSLFDEISLSASFAKASDIKLEICGEAENLPRGEKNIAYRAAALYLEEAKISAAVEMKIKKNIPISAGLAGGSSDAAAVLRALNQFFSAFSEERLSEISLKLGSDIPYCLFGGVKLCLGRGEVLSPLSSLSGTQAVIAIGKSRISTPEAYRYLDEIYSDFSHPRPRKNDDLFDRAISAISGGRAVDIPLFNIFESALGTLRDEIEEIKSLLVSMGASSALMSGSGPAVFGIFAKKTKAESAKRFLISQGIDAYTANII